MLHGSPCVYSCSHCHQMVTHIEEQSRMGPGSKSTHICGCRPTRFCQPRRKQAHPSFQDCPPPPPPNGAPHVRNWLFSCTLGPVEKLRFQGAIRQILGVLEPLLGPQPMAGSQMLSPSFPDLSPYGAPLVRNLPLSCKFGLAKTLRFHEWGYAPHQSSLCDLVTPCFLV